jgi:glycosyltransferase involved in cell wall biosynthesis
MKIKATIGLCVKNGAKVLKASFHSISIQDYPHESMKLVIVDNGSSDNTLSLVSEFAKETDIKTLVTSSKGKGLGATRQVAVDNAEGEYIVWVDDDFVLSKDFIRNQIDFMEKNPNLGATRGIDVEVLRNSSIYHVANYGSLLPISPNPQKIGTGGSIFRLKALHSVGGFDIRIKGAGEDIDVSLRIKKAGWTLSTNNLAKIYKTCSPVTPKVLWNKDSWYGYGNHFLFHKYKDNELIMEYLLPYSLLSGLKMSYLIYRATNLKKAFLFPIFHSFLMIPQSIGFIRAHLDGYGHINSG